MKAARMLRETGASAGTEHVRQCHGLEHQRTHFVEYRRTGICLIVLLLAKASDAHEAGCFEARKLALNGPRTGDRKSTRLNSSHMSISYAVFCLKKKTKIQSLLS